MPRGLVVIVCIAASLTQGHAASADAPAAVLDRAVVRFIAPETGGPRSPRFVFERTLAFEARLEAVADPDFRPTPERPFIDRHLRAALERHIAETLLASLKIDPRPTSTQLDRQTENASRLLAGRVGGEQKLRDAARSEGLGDGEVSRIVRRQARASLYLDTKVTPMLHPSDAELRANQRQTPFRDQPFERTAPALRRWYVSQRLAAALAAYFRDARTRLSVTILKR